MKEHVKSRWVVYMMLCSDGSLYIGCTNNLEKRLIAHNTGKGAKYTRSRLPVSLVYTQYCENRSDSLKQEYALKQLTHSEKILLVARHTKTK